MNPAPLTLPLPSFGALEERLDEVLPGADCAPQTLHQAMRHAVFPGGKRVRPRLLLAVAGACAAAGAEAELALTAACSVELLHCASLVHDDLPCFDDAPLRRGLPSVHARYGEAMAVLVGDALLTRAFDVLADTPPRLARRALRIVSLCGRATGSRDGIIGGQSMESGYNTGAPAEALTRYHAMKTAALFRLAAEAGATAAGATDAAAWAEVGESLGLAYQLADDLLDVLGDAATLGKPVSRDGALGRPNAALISGERAVRARLLQLLEHARGRMLALAVEPAPLSALIDELSGMLRRFSAG